MSSSFVADSWVRRPRAIANPELRLFCLPYAGGGASMFSSWPGSLPSSIEVCAIQFPGRESRVSDPPFVRMQPLVEQLCSVLSPYLNVPFAVFGHSMGALIGFELCHELRRQAMPSPAKLFVSGHRAPHLPNPRAPIHQLTDGEFRRAVRQLNGTPDEILQHAELWQLLLPTFRADFSICETYIYQMRQPLDCLIMAFGGLNDNEVTCTEISAWREHTRAAFTMHMLPGNHFFPTTSKDQLLRLMTCDLLELL